MFNPAKYGKEYAEKQDVKSSVSGLYGMEIKRCFIEESEEDSKFQWSRVTILATPRTRVNIDYKKLQQKPENMVDVVAVEIDGKRGLFKYAVKNEEIQYPTKDDEKEYKFQMYVQRNGKETFETKLFMSMYYLLVPEPKFSTKQMDVDVYDFDQKAFVAKKIPNYSELIGKTIGVEMQFIRMFPQVAMNGYTGEKLFNKSDRDACKYVVWVRDYKLDRTPDFKIKHFFNIETLQTLSEMSENKPAKVIIQENYHLDDYIQKEKSDKEQEEEREKALNKILNRIKEPFDKTAFISRVSNVGTTTTSEYAPAVNMDDLAIDDLEDL